MEWPIQMKGLQKVMFRAVMSLYEDVKKSTINNE